MDFPSEHYPSKNILVGKINLIYFLDICIKGKIFHFSPQILRPRRDWGQETIVSVLLLTSVENLRTVQMAKFGHQGTVCTKNTLFHLFFLQTLKFFDFQLANLALVLSNHPSHHVLIQYLTENDNGSNSESNPFITSTRGCFGIGFFWDAKSEMKNPWIF